MFYTKQTTLVNTDFTYLEVLKIVKDIDLINLTLFSFFIIKDGI